MAEGVAAAGVVAAGVVAKTSLGLVERRERGGAWF